MFGRWLIEWTLLIYPKKKRFLIKLKTQPVDTRPRINRLFYA